MKRTILENPPLVVVGSQTLAADLTSGTIDMIDAAGNELLVHVGAGGVTFDATNRIDVKVTHSDDDVTYTPVGQNDVIVNGDDDNLIVDAASGNVKSFNAAHPAATVDRIAYVGGRRYLKVFLDLNGTHNTGTPVGVLLIQTRPHLTGKA